MTDRATTFRSVTRLEGKKVFLEPFTIACADENHEAYLESREEIHRYLPWENRSVDDSRAFAEKAERWRAAGEQMHLVIRSSGAGRMLGTIGAHHIDPFTPRCEIGYWIRSNAAGNGFATDALAAFLAFLRGPAGFARVTAKAAVTNLASQRVLVRNGFQEEGLEPKGELCHGVWHDLKLYGRLFS